MHPELEDLIHRYPDLTSCVDAVAEAFDTLGATFRAGGKLLICGNGGSAADADHLVGELMKGYERPRPVAAAVRQRLEAIDAARADRIASQLQGALPAISLTSHVALLSAISNDTAAEMVFAQQVYGYGRPGDALMAISTSGNSTNVINALVVARATGVRTIGMSGRTGGAMVGLCDVLVRIPSDHTSAVQERHLPIYHSLCRMLEDEFFGPTSRDGNPTR